MANKQAAVKVIRRLHKEGYHALLAGGCVRDMLLGRAAKDFDVATNARPQQIVKLFRRTLKIGAKFGVIMVLLGDKQIEVATFRAEAGYSDGRHPDSVKFVEAREDAKRRDFTINGMFYEPVEKKVIDHVKGMGDLAKKIVRAIGDPDQRFGEDYLRMLRAVRFSTQLGFKIAPATWSAVCKHAKKITMISGERICAELEAILADTNRSKGAELLFKSGLAETIFPGISSHAKKAIAVLEQLPARVDLPLAMAAFFAGCETGFAIEKCRVLKLSRNQSRHINFLLVNRSKLLESQMSLAELKMILAEPYFDDLYRLQKAIQKAEKKSLGELLKLKKRIKALGDVELKPKPLLNGHDLIRLGAAAGPVLGQLAEEMYIAQLEGTLTNGEEAEKWVQKWLKMRKSFEK